ncbi:centrosomal protein of 164 kDa-like isoform X2 [Haliotis rufescens]|uniref:centrosomal protein of 164 kDa-like isoform X2 n=1 Tax=Haliotis rufescens TaxID=6454 RepID=UPI00201EDE91|nr:centrosomal protein of 164 kDa-like isoform X2 [Haliotis rufescens]
MTGMMINNQVILEEDYDENYEPTEPEVYEYAQIIGLDPNVEPHLMWIAKEGINAPLPENWKPCQDPEQNIYYFNFATGESIWDHPCDEFYRAMVVEERRKHALNKSGPQKKKGKPVKEDLKKKKEKPGFKQLGPLKAEPSRGTPSLHQGRNQLGPLKSSEGQATAGSSQLAPLRGSAGASQPIRSSMNTTTGSLKSSKMNMTSSMSIPIYSTEYDDEDEKPTRRLLDDTQDIGALGYEESDPGSVQDRAPIKIETDSDSDDYQKDVDFFINSKLSEQLMDIETMDPVMRESLEKDIELTSSLKSTARESPLEDDRKRMADMAASAADRRLVKDEEQKVQTANDRAVSDMKRRMEKELENAKLELLEDKDSRLRKLKAEIRREQEEEERKLRDEKEESIKLAESRLQAQAEQEREDLKDARESDLSKLREECERKKQDEEKKLREEMQLALQRLREEVKSLQAEEQDKLEEEKAKALDKLHSQVDVALSSEREKLEAERNRKMEKLRSRQAQELEDLEDELERKHKAKVDDLRSDLQEKHSKAMREMQMEVKRLQAEQSEQQEQELEVAQKRQRTINDMEKGLDEVLAERRQEMKEDQKKRMEKLRKDHEEELRKMQEEYRNTITKEQRNLTSTFEAEKRRLEKQHSQEMESLKRQCARKRESLQEQLEDEEEEIREKSADLERKKKDIEKSFKNLDIEEQRLDDRREKFREDQNKLDQQQDDAFGNRAQSLTSHELERMREERKQLQEEIRMARTDVEAFKKDKRILEGDVLKLKMTRDQNTRKLNELKEKLDKKTQELEKLHLRINEAIEENETAGRQLLHSTTRVADQTAGRLSMDDLHHTDRRASNPLLSEEDDSSIQVPIPGSKKKSVRMTDEAEMISASVLDMLSDDEPESFVTGTFSRVLRDHLKKESSSIGLAKTFLRKQRQSLKRRQAALTAAKQELTRDMSLAQQGPLPDDSARLLDDVRSSLEMEALKLDQMEVQMAAGSRLVREKELKIRQLENCNVSDSETEYTPFEHRYKPMSLPSLDISDDDESSGISSTDYNLDNFIQGLTKQHQQLQQHQNQHQHQHHHTPPAPGSSSSVHNESAPSPSNPLAQSLYKINSELSRVLGMISTNTHQPPPTGGSTHSSASTNPQYPIYVPHAPNTPYSSWATDNRYVHSPLHRVDYSNLAHTAEVSLERKWRKYFGDRRPPLTSASTLTTGSVGIGHPPVREQLRQYRLSLLETHQQPGVSTSDRLAEHKQWLHRFQQDISFGASIVRQSGSDAGSITSLGGASDQKSYTEPFSSTPARPTHPASHRGGGAIRLELDDNNDIVVRQYQL